MSDSPPRRETQTSLLRSLLETSTHGLVFPRRLPVSFGTPRVPLWVSPEGGLRYLTRPLGEIDPALLRLASTLVEPGATVWDVGANVGLFSFAAAARAGATGRVLAVEPDTWCVELLHRSSRLRGRRAPVDVVGVAAAGSMGIAELFIARRSRATNYLAGGGSSQTGGVRARQLVPAVTLDWLLDQMNMPPPSLVKIDCEGLEDKVLDGAERLLSVVRPILICEVSSERADRVGEILSRHRYQLFDGDAVGLPSVGRPVWSTVARPLS